MDKKKVKDFQEIYDRYVYGDLISEIEAEPKPDKERGGNAVLLKPIEYKSDRNITANPTYSRYQRKDIEPRSIYKYEIDYKKKRHLKPVKEISSKKVKVLKGKEEVKRGRPKKRKPLKTSTIIYK